MAPPSACVTRPSLSMQQHAGESSRQCEEWHFPAFVQLEPLVSQRRICLGLAFKLHRSINLPDASPDHTSDCG